MDLIIMDADERPTDDTPLPPTGWMDSENQPVPYRTQHTKEGSLRLSNYMSVSYFPTFHQMPTNEIPTSPSMSTPSLSPLQSVGSSSSQSSAMTTPTSSLARPPPVPPKSSVSKFPYSVDERKVPEQPRRPPLVQLPTVEQNKELETWLLSHMSYPCPTHEEQQRLARCTGLSVHQVVTWLSRARSRKLTQNSPFQKCPPTTTPVLEEHASQSSLQCSSLTIEVGGERISPQSFSTIPEPKASENSGASTYVAPPTVSGESITSSLSVLVHAVDIVERLNRTKPSKLDEAASPLISVIPAATSRPSLRDTIDKQSGGGINMELWLSQSQESLPSSPETDSVNSFEDDSPEDSSGDEDSSRDESSSGYEDRNTTMSCWSTSEGLSMLSMLRPLFATMSDEISQPLTRDLTLLFDCWAVRGSLERPSYPASSSSSTPPQSQANGSVGSSTEHTSSSGSGKKRALRDGSESPGDGDDDQNGDETRKHLRLNSQSQEDIAPRWACPFYQRSPHHYCVETEYGDYRKCAKSPGFSGVHRVKGHIYKCHVSIYCDRCYSVFKNEDDLTTHRRNPSPCTVQDPRPMRGLTNGQKKLLKPRDRNKSEEARWSNIYRICFPDDEFIPSPYYIFYSRETAELRRDIFDIVEEETRSLDDTTVRDRIRERLQHAFNNVQMRSSLEIMGLPTPLSSEISSQKSREAGPSPRLPLAPRSAAVTSISQQAIPAVNAEPGHMAPTQNPPFGELQGYDADDHMLFGSMIGYPAGEVGEDVPEIFPTYL